MTEHDPSALEDNHLLTVLLRLNHQDLSLEAIKTSVKEMATEVKTLRSDVSAHIAREGEIKDSIDDIVSFYKGSKLMGRVTAWLVGIGAAILGAYVSLKKMLVS